LYLFPCRSLLFDGFVKEPETISEIKHIETFDLNFGGEGGLGGSLKLDQWFS